MRGQLAGWAFKPTVTPIKPRHSGRLAARLPFQIGKTRTSLFNLGVYVMDNHFKKSWNAHLVLPRRRAAGNTATHCFFMYTSLQ